MSRGAGRDTKSHAHYSAGGTFNSGLVFIRASKRGLQFAEAWHGNVVHPPRGSRYAALTSDQQVKLHALRMGQGISARSSRRLLPQVFNHMMRKPNQWPGISAPDGSHVMRGWDDQASSELGGSSRRLISAIYLSGADQVTLGALPLALFQNGHGYFVQAS